MKYFFDTEFIEGKQDKRFLGFKCGETKPTIDLISIGIVDEVDDTYYAISKDFNLEEAWNRYDLKQVGKKDAGMTPVFEKVYWIRENVLKPIWNELFKTRGRYQPYQANILWNELPDVIKFVYFKLLLLKYGKSNKQIAEEIIEFVNKGEAKPPQGRLEDKPFKPEFYGYYSSSDWVAFYMLFGKMINLPKGFPFYCRDLKQIADNITDTLKISTRFESPKNEHNALADAKWNLEFYRFLRDAVHRHPYIFIF